jgi:hypothetical protein
MRILLVLIMAASLAPAADPSLLNMAMPESKVLFGVDVDRARDSVFGRFVLSQLGKEDKALASMTEATGFDPRRDLHEIVIASMGDIVPNSTLPGNGLIMLRGNFDPSRISALIKNMGMGSPLTYQGQEIFTSPKAKDNAGFAVVDRNTAILGNIGSVKSALDRRRSGKAIDAKTLAKVQQLSLVNDVWLMTTMSMSDIAGRIPGPPQAGAMMKGDAMKGIQQAAAGLKFTPSDVRISAEATAGSAKDAGALADVVRFVSGMLQLNRDNAEVSDFAGVIDSLQVKTEGNVFRLNITVPQDQLEQLWKETPAKKRSAVRKV